MKMERLEKLLLGNSLTVVEDNDLRTTHEAMKRVSDLAGALIRIAILSVLAGFIFVELQVLTNSPIDVAFVPLFIIVLVTLCALTLRFFVFLMALSCSVFFEKSFAEIFMTVFVVPQFDHETEEMIIPDNFPGVLGKVKFFVGTFFFVALVISIVVAIGGIVFGLDKFIG